MLLRQFFIKKWRIFLRMLFVVLASGLMILILCLGLGSFLQLKGRASAEALMLDNEEVIKRLTYESERVEIAPLTALIGGHDQKLLSRVWPSSPVEPDAARERFSRPPIVESYLKGELRTGSTFPTLILEGTSLEMGVQYGALQGHRIQEFLDYLDKVAHEQGSQAISKERIHEIRRWLGSVFWKHFPEESKEIIYGIADGARKRADPVTLHLMDLAFINSFIDIVGIGATDLSFDFAGFDAAGALVSLAANEVGLGWIKQNCDTFAAFGRRTQGGKTFQTRNTDVDTGMGLENFPLVVVYKGVEHNGTRQIPFVGAGFVGQVGVFTGMNAFGVGLGQVWAFSNEKNFGTPWSLVMREVMRSATSATEAGRIFSSWGKRTYGNNFIFADAQGDAVVLESDARQIDFFRANDPRESTEGVTKEGEVYALPMEDAVFRADFSVSRRLRRSQTSSRGPNGDPRESSAYRKRYKGQADLIQMYEENGVKIGKEEAEFISRKTASREGNLQNAVYANSDLLMWVSYATIEDKDSPPGSARAKKSVREAYRNEYVLVPFREYIRDPFLSR